MSPVSVSAADEPVRFSISVSVSVPAPLLTVCATDVFRFTVTPSGPMFSYQAIESVVEVKIVEVKIVEVLREAETISRSPSPSMSAM